MHDAWHSYPKIFALGHAAVRDVLRESVLIEEKVDGSQFSFGKFIGEDGAPYLRCRSRGGELNVDAPESLFKQAVQTARDLFDVLHEGWSYRAEYLAKPKHNTLCYDRTPVKYLILFDVSIGREAYLDYDAKSTEAARVGLEVVPLVHQGEVASIEVFRSFLDRQSVLGGQSVEGVVVKNYARFGLDGHALMGKFVSEAFKEVHAGDWKERNPKQGDVVARLIAAYRTPARWSKSVQHLREAGQLEDSPRDIGKLILATGADIETECATEIKDALFAWAWPHIRRGTCGGVAEWYKDELLKKQFEMPIRSTEPVPQ